MQALLGQGYYFHKMYLPPSVCNLIMKMWDPTLGFPLSGKNNMHCASLSLFQKNKIKLGQFYSTFRLNNILQLVLEMAKKVVV